MSVFSGYTKIGRVTIGDNVFVGIDAIILPNVEIGNNVAIGAGTVVSKSIPDNTVVAGNPMRVLSSYDAYCEKVNGLLSHRPAFKAMKSLNGEQIENMKETLQDGFGFVESPDSIYYGEHQENKGEE